MSPGALHALLSGRFRSWDALAASDPVGDPSATRTVYTAVVVLVVLGVVLAALAGWILRRTRPEPELLAPLEEMDTRRWRRLDPATQRRLLDVARPDGAVPLVPSMSEPDIDIEFMSNRPVTGFEDLAEERVVAEEDPADAPHDGTGGESEDRPAAGVDAHVDAPPGSDTGSNEVGTLEPPTAGAATTPDRSVLVPARSASDVAVTEGLGPAAAAPVEAVVEVEDDDTAPSGDGRPVVRIGPRPDEDGRMRQPRPSVIEVEERQSQIDDVPLAGWSESFVEPEHIDVPDEDAETDEHDRPDEIADRARILSDPTLFDAGSVSVVPGEGLLRRSGKQPD